MGDYHVHLHPHGASNPLGPALGEYPPGHIEGFVQAAATRGADEVGFTEHLYRCREAAPVLGEFWKQAPTARLAQQAEEFFLEDLQLSLGGYVEAVTSAQDRGLPVLLGLEVDFFPDTIPAVLDLLAPYPWDFLIGSVHWVDGWSIDHTDATWEFERRGIRQSYEDYFAMETELAASGAVDVLAHVDVVKKMGYKLAEPPVDLYAPVVAAAADSGTAVEISSAGLHQPAGEIYPNSVFLSMFSEADVPITLASDAHYPEDCARDRDLLVEAARAAGYTQRLRFKKRTAEFVDLE